MEEYFIKKEDVSKGSCLTGIDNDNVLSADLGDTNVKQEYFNIKEKYITQDTESEKFGYSIKNGCEDDTHSDKNTAEMVKEKNKTECTTDLYGFEKENKNTHKLRKQTDEEEVSRISMDLINDVIESAERTIEQILSQRKQENVSTQVCDLPATGNIYINEKVDEENGKLFSLENSVNGTISLMNSEKYCDWCLTENSESGSAYDRSNQYIQNSVSPIHLNETNSNIKDEFIDGDTICGFGCFRPNWLQKWATPRAYVVLYSIVGILHGSYYSYLVSTMSTIEKRFAFKNKISGAVMVSDEFAPLFLGILGGYYSGKGHRPRILAIGMFLSASCCIVTSLPYFFYGTVQHFNILNIKNQTGPEICALSMKDETCGINDRPPTMPAVLLLLFGSFFKGFGNVAY